MTILLTLTLPTAIPAYHSGIGVSCPSSARINCLSKLYIYILKTHSPKCPTSKAYTLCPFTIITRILETDSKSNRRCVEFG